MVMIPQMKESFEKGHPDIDVVPNRVLNGISFVQHNTLDILATIKLEEEFSLHINDNLEIGSDLLEDIHDFRKQLLEQAIRIPMIRDISKVL